MSELEEAVARLERAVARLEAAPGLAAGADAAAAPAERDEARLREIAGQIVARVDAALERIGQVLEEDC